jgi:hypothetical protein
MRAVLLAVVVVGCAAFGMASGVRGDEHERKTLRDAGPFKVDVVQLTKSAVQHGLNHDAIDAAVELRLRRNGVKLDDKATHFLVVSAQHWSLSSDVTVWTIELKFSQPVTVRANGELTLAPTWQEGRDVVCLSSESRIKVSDAIDGLVDQFTNDYLAANEKVEAGTGR